MIPYADMHRLVVDGWIMMINVEEVRKLHDTNKVLVQVTMYDVRVKCTMYKYKVD